MKMIAVGLMLLFSGSVSANVEESPYADMQKWDIKSLSSNEVLGYLAGEGMGLARAAELNHYPGPSHVLELSDDLKLTHQQRESTTEIFQEMRQEAVELGESYIAKEKELEKRFSTHSIDSADLQKILNEISAIKSRLRYVHLEAHLKMRHVLTEEQINQYDRLRGYESTNKVGHHKHHH